MLGSTQQWTQHPMQARVIHCPFDLQVTDLENFATCISCIQRTEIHIFLPFAIILSSPFIRTHI